MKTLDLHGIRHEEVERLLENFILLNEPPLKVITGNSNYMQTALESFCSKHNVSYERWAIGGNIQYYDTRKENISKIYTMVKLSIRISKLIFLCKQ